MTIFWIYTNSTVIFTTGKTTPSLIVVVNSPQNRTYTSNNVPLSISASDPELHIGPESVAYSVDGGPQVTIATVHVGMHSLNGSTVLSLPNGPHSIVGIGITWFNGTDGVFYSSPVYFTVESDSGYPEPEPIPATLIVAASAVTFSVVGGLLFYFKKRRH
jgi:hypothetical protein